MTSSVGLWKRVELPYGQRRTKVVKSKDSRTSRKYSGTDYIIQCWRSPNGQEPFLMRDCRFKIILALSILIPSLCFSFHHRGKNHRGSAGWVSISSCCCSIILLCLLCQTNPISRSVSGACSLISSLFRTYLVVRQFNVYSILWGC